MIGKRLVFSMALAALAVCALGRGLLAAEPPPAPQSEGTAAASQQKLYDPANTKVAVIPFANAAGGGPGQKDPCEGATQFIRHELAARGFQVLDEKDVVLALKKTRIDFADQEDRKKDKFHRVGEELGADLVVSGVLLYYKAHGAEYAYARIELKAYDVRDRAYCLRGLQAGNVKRHSYFWAGSARGVALVHTIDKLLRDFLKPYPVTKKQEPAPSSG